MKGLQLAEPGQRLSVLCLGAHSDDIEIGAGATLLQWQASGVRLDVHWCVLSAAGPREAEARASAADFSPAPSAPASRSTSSATASFPPSSPRSRPGSSSSRAASSPTSSSPTTATTRTRTTAR